MERLTKRSENGGVYSPEELVGFTLTPDDATMYRFLCCLASCEDTGLTPEKVLPKKMADEVAMKLLRLADSESFAPYERLRQLAAADRDGRLVALTCKVGQRVFALLDTDKHISECEVKQIGMGNKIGFIGLEPIGARGLEYSVALNGFGKTVFLTREDAEKALEAMKDE